MSGTVRRSDRCLVGPWTTPARCPFSRLKSPRLYPPRPRASRAATGWSKTTSDPIKTTSDIWDWQTNAWSDRLGKLFCRLFCRFVLQMQFHTDMQILWIRQIYQLNNLKLHKILCLLSYGNFFSISRTFHIICTVASGQRQLLLSIMCLMLILIIFKTSICTSFIQFVEIWQRTVGNLLNRKWPRYWGVFLAWINF